MENFSTKGQVYLQGEREKLTPFRPRACNPFLGSPPRSANTWCVCKDRHSRILPPPAVLLWAGGHGTSWVCESPRDRSCVCTGRCLRGHPCRAGWPGSPRHCPRHSTLLCSFSGEPDRQCCSAAPHNPVTLRGHPDTPQPHSVSAPHSSGPRVLTSSQPLCCPPGNGVLSPGGCYLDHVQLGHLVLCQAHGQQDVIFLDQHVDSQALGVETTEEMISRASQAGSSWSTAAADNMEADQLSREEREEKRKLTYPKSRQVHRNTHPTEASARGAVQPTG